MIISKKKRYNAFKLTVSLVGLSMFFFISVWGVLTDRPGPEKLLLVLFLIGSTYGLWMCWKGFQKVLSANPELELTKDILVLYDNVEYSKIKFTDMIDCWIFYTPRQNALLGISLKPSVPHKSNANVFHKMAFTLKPGHPNMVFIPLSFADIDPEMLCSEVKKRIRQTVGA